MTQANPGVPHTECYECVGWTPCESESAAPAKPVPPFLKLEEARAQLFAEAKKAGIHWSGHGHTMQWWVNKATSLKHELLLTRSSAAGLIKNKTTPSDDDPVEAMERLIGLDPPRKNPAAPSPVLTPSAERLQSAIDDAFGLAADMKRRHKQQLDYEEAERPVLPVPPISERERIIRAVHHAAQKQGDKWLVPNEEMVNALALLDELSARSSSPVVAPTPRCSVTSNLCGSDTWMKGHECACVSCQKYIASLAPAVVGRAQGDSKAKLGIGVSVLMLRAGKLLLGERINIHGAGLFSTPGGSLEQNEDVFACAIRETAEETGLCLDRTDLSQVGFKEHFRFGKHYFMVYVLAKNFEGNLINKEPDKCKEWRWFGLEDIPENCIEPLDILAALREPARGEGKIILESALKYLINYPSLEGHDCDEDDAIEMITDMLGLYDRN